MIWLLLALLAGCGVDVLELTPGLDGDVLIIGDVPTRAITRLASDETSASDPKMLAFAYPNEGSAVPADLAPIRFQWSGPKKPEGTVYELRLRAATAQLRVYTQAADVTVPAERWSAFLAQVVNEDVECELRALELMGKQMLRSAEARTLHVRPALAVGPLYLLANDVSQARIADATTSPSQEPAERARAAIDARGRVLRVGRGQLSIVEGAQTVQTLSAAEGSRLAHPSWAPDGSAVVFTYWPPELKLADDPSDDREGAAIARFALPDGTFSLLVPAGSRPRYSPDGRWIAYQSAAKMPDDASLWLIASGGGAPRRIACSAMPMPMPTMPKADGALAGSAPAWLADGWLAFVSSAPYGEAMKHDQLWLSALDLSGTADVACTSPVWLPFQAPDQDYQSLSL